MLAFRLLMLVDEMLNGLSEKIQDKQIQIVKNKPKVEIHLVTDQHVWSEFVVLYIT